MAGDFSPLSIEAAPGHARVAPPALLVAVALGLGTIDMPVPSVEEWVWLNWKFPRPVHAGDTIYARWTLTQKRAPIGGAPNSIVVWRVDVHRADGELCAEGEVGAKVRRRHLSARDRERAQEPAAQAGAATTGGAAAPRRRRGRRRPAGGNGPLPEPPAVAAAPAQPERAAGAPRRRRRRRPAGGTASRDGETAGSPPAAEPAPATAPTAAQPTVSATERGGLSRVIRRLRQPRKT
ncbi:MAG: MaoC family dehydratase [Candidatus Dormibacteraceae bacterium]